MARRVYFHIGLPKTGTTYLQSILWGNRDRLLAQGVLLPGRSAREHLWASGVVREDPDLSRRGPDAPRAWERILAEVNAWPETAVVSHEFFAGATADQARRAVAALDGAEAHVVLTARDTLSLVTARWQELVKNGATTPIDDYPAGEETSPHDEWDWGTMDAADVLGRWGPAVPEQNVHLVTLPKPDAPRDQLWQRFATVMAIDPASCDSYQADTNESLGVVEVELLRRVNGDVSGFDAPFDRGVWIRGYLAEGKLVPRGGEKLWPAAPRIEALRDRNRRTVERLRGKGYDVVGDLDDLSLPDDPPARRHPSSVTDAELVEAATRTIAEMLADVRDLRQQLNEAQRAPEPAEAVELVAAAAAGRLKQFLGRIPGLAGLARRVRRRPVGKPEARE